MTRPLLALCLAASPGAGLLPDLDRTPGVVDPSVTPEKVCGTAHYSRTQNDALHLPA